MLRLLFLCLFAFFFIPAPAQNNIPKTEALLIREAKLIADTHGDKIWKGFSSAPFTLLLITDSLEYLMFHPYPSNDFKLQYRDSILQTDIYTRARNYPKEWLATFPAVNGVNCIVVGTPKNTGRSFTNWMITLLHEHFHQFVNSQPGYFDSVNKLNLSGGDETGMWMLNYPFPYDSAVILKQYQKFKLALSVAVDNLQKKGFNRSLQVYLKEKKIFKSLLKPEDYRYFSFQLWNEGLSTYTEYKFLELLGDHKFSTDLAFLEDLKSLSLYKNDFFTNQISSLKSLKLDTDKRVCFYPIGFAEGLLLDKLNKTWRSKFFTKMFDTDQYFTLKK